MIYKQLNSCIDHLHPRNLRHIQVFLLVISFLQNERKKDIFQKEKREKRRINALVFLIIDVINTKLIE